MKIISKLTYFAAALLLLVGCLDTVSAQNNAFTFSPTSLTFTTVPGQSPAPQSLTIGTTGASVTFSVTSSFNQPGCSTLSVGGGNFTTPSTLQVFTNAASLPQGTYPCTLTFTSNTAGVAAASVQVTIVVGSGGGTSGQVSVAPTALSLSAQSGTTPVTGTLTLTNANPATPVSFTATPSTQQGTWLRINPISGTVTNTQQITVQADPTGLQAQSYTGSITITPQGGTAIAVPVTFVVSGNPTLQITQNGSPLPSSGVSFAYESGKTLPAGQTLSFASSASGTPISFSVSPGAGSSFLVVTPSGIQQTTPGTVSLQIANTASTLPPGLYQTTLTVSAPGSANPTTTIPVKFLVSATPLLTLGTTPAAFMFQTGGATPAAQTVQVATTSTALSFTVSTDQAWLVVGPISGTASAATPVNLSVSVNPSGLAPGTYTGNVTITSPGAGNSPVTFPVTLTVSASTLLSATPSSMSFSFQTTAGGIPPAQTINIGSSGASLAFNAAVNYSGTGCGTNWITLSQTTGNTGTSGVPISLSVNPAGITPPANCAATVSITSPGAPNTINIPVMLEVSANALITVNNANVNLTAQIGAGITNATTFSITSTDSTTPLQFFISNPAPWLTVTPTQGTTPQTIQVRADPSYPGLQVGANTATLTINSPSLPAGGTLQVPVTLTLTSAATVTPSATAVSFTQAAGGPAPTAQTVNLTVTGATGPIAFNASATSDFSWLTVTPASGAVPGALTVSANGSTLSQGVYRGNVQVTTTPASASGVINIPVTLTIGPPQSLAVTPASLTFNAAFGATVNPATQPISITATGGPLAYTVSAVSTNCGSFLSASPATGTATATATTVNVGVNAANVPAGVCTGTVTVSAPGVASQTVNVTFNVSAPAPPQITTIVNGASFAPGAIAPGEIVTIFGSNIGPATLTTYTITNGLFDTKVADTEILFDGVPAPIIFVRNDQLAVVVPFNLEGRVQTNIQVRRSGVLSNILQQRVVEAAPGIFTIPSGGSGQGAIVNQNGTINGPGAPAAQGTVAAIYITGAGQTNPLGVTGGISGTNPLNLIPGPVTVTIGGQAGTGIGGVDATVVYKGGAPGNIQGLYQINVLIPQGAPTGTQQVLVKVGGVPSQGNVTMVIQ